MQSPSDSHFEDLTSLLVLHLAKQKNGDRQGALKDLSEADNLGQLEFDIFKWLGELHSTLGNVATTTFDRAAVIEPSNARFRQ